jgi:leucyl aminopeptidase
LKSKSIRAIAILLDPGFTSAEHVAAAVEGAILGDFEPDLHKSDKKDAKVVDRFLVLVPGGDTSLEAARRRGEIIAESQNMTRELVNEPANRMTPRAAASENDGFAEQNSNARSSTRIG